MAVIDANDQNIKGLLAENPKVIVKFFAGWCGSCRLFKPKFKRLSEDERFQKITFIDIDAEANPEIRKISGVQNLPTFVTFFNGELLQLQSTSQEDQVVSMLHSLLEK